jgi:hypothetical protein
MAKNKTSFQKGHKHNSETIEKIREWLYNNVELFNGNKSFEDNMKEFDNARKRSLRNLQANPEGKEFGLK